MPSELTGKVILVVEDEYFIAEVLCEALYMEGFHVMGPFAELSQADHALNGGTLPDAALLDINVKGEPVYPLADRLVAMEVPIVLTTGYDVDAIPSDYLHLLRLQKPVSLQKLFHHLKGVIH